MPVSYSPAEYASLLQATPAASIYIDGAFVETGAPQRIRQVERRLHRRVRLRVDEGRDGDCYLRACCVPRLGRQSARRTRQGPARDRRVAAKPLPRIVALESHHGGKTIADAEIDIRASIATLQWFAGCAERLDGRLVASAATMHRYVRREALGVCALIVPRNFPLLLMTWKIAPALAAGNTIVVKPASETPLSALAFAHWRSRPACPQACSMSRRDRAV